MGHLHFISRYHTFVCIFRWVDSFSSTTSEWNASDSQREGHTNCYLSCILEMTCWIQNQHRGENMVQTYHAGYSITVGFGSKQRIFLDRSPWKLGRRGDMGETVLISISYLSPLFRKRVSIFLCLLYVWRCFFQSRFVSSVTLYLKIVRTLNSASFLFLVLVQRLVGAFPKILPMTVLPHST